MGERDAIDRDHIEAHVDRRGSSFTEPALGQRADLCLLHRGDRRGGDAVAVGAPGLHLAEHQEVGVASNDVEVALELSFGRPPTGGDDLEAERRQMCGSAAFAPAAPRTIREIGQNSRFSRTLAALPTRSRR